MSNRKEEKRDFRKFVNTYSELCPQKVTGLKSARPCHEHGRRLKITVCGNVRAPSVL
jgi:hypothetical protein